jgi:hypothetical protein
MPLTAGIAVGLEPTSFYGYRVRHMNYVGRIDPISTSSPLVDRQDSSFTVRPGLADPTCVSFQSVNFPTRYLHNQNYQLYLHVNDASALFAADATFCPVPGLTGQYTSFRSYNNPGRYLRIRNSQAYLDTFDGTDQMRKDATFAVRPALAGPSVYQIASQSRGTCLNAGTGPQLATCAGTAAQGWSYTGVKQLIAGDGRCLATVSGAPALAGCDSLSDQQWLLNPNGTISNVSTGLCLDAQASGPTLATCTAVSSQLWKVS